MADEESKYGKIDRRLNVVLTVTTAKGDIHVHSIPISKAVYDAHWEVMTNAVNDMYMQRYLPPMCIRVGLKMLLKAAERLNARKAVEKDLLPNIWKLTTVIMPDGQLIPLDVAMASGDTFDPEDLEEVKEYLVYFTSASWVHPKRELGPMLYTMLEDSGGLFGSWSATEFATSLRTSKPEENTGGSPTTPSVPH